jgi:hypothetical protein
MAISSLTFGLERALLHKQQTQLLDVTKASPSQRTSRALTPERSMLASWELIWLQCWAFCLECADQHRRDGTDLSCFPSAALPSEATEPILSVGPVELCRCRHTRLFVYPRRRAAWPPSSGNDALRTLGVPSLQCHAAQYGWGFPDTDQPAKSQGRYTVFQIGISCSNYTRPQPVFVTSNIVFSRARREMAGRRPTHGRGGVKPLVGASAVESHHRVPAVMWQSRIKSCGGAAACSPSRVEPRA